MQKYGDYVNDRSAVEYLASLNIRRQVAQAYSPAGSDRRTETVLEPAAQHRECDFVVEFTDKRTASPFRGGIYVAERH